MNGSSTDFESVSLDLKSLIKLTFIVVSMFFLKISKNIPSNVKAITLQMV